MLHSIYECRYFYTDYYGAKYYGHLFRVALVYTDQSRNDYERFN